MMDTSSFSIKRAMVDRCVFVKAEGCISNLMQRRNGVFCRFVTAFILNISLVVPANSSGWLSTLSGEDAAGNVAVLEFGYDIEATDQIDFGMGELEMPPPPPRGEFYAVWSLPETGSRTLRDIRKTPARGDSLIFVLSVQYTGTIEIVWETDQLGQGLNAASLSDLFGGKFVHTDMIRQGKIIIENNKLRHLMLVIHPRSREVVTSVKAENSVVSQSHGKQGRVEPITIYPNPGNNAITLRFDTSFSEISEIAIINLKGQKIRTFNSYQLNKTTPFVTWDGLTDRNQPVASGVYWALVRSKSKIFTRSFVYLR